METNPIIGFIGSALILFAYIPQIYHLVKEHCSAGISRYAYALWLCGSILLLIHSFLIKDLVFIALQSINGVSTAIILIFAMIYRDNTCPSHKK